MGRCTAAEPAVACEAECRAVKDVGEPCAGEPHTRFEGEGLEQATVSGSEHRRETAGTGATTYGSYRASPLPDRDLPFTTMSA